jgi:hypothetical protein
LLIGVDPLIDLVPAGAVVADGGLYEAERQLKIACRLGGVAVVVADGRDDLPDVFAGSCQPGARRPAGPSANRMSGCSSILSPSST